MVRIGAHLHDSDPLAAAKLAGAEAAQFFLGDPQGWKAPTFPLGGDPAEVQAAFAAAAIDIYIHAPYVINVASPNNRIRIPSRKLLEQQLKAAASIGARALIVHGGHVTAGVGPEEGYDSWRKAVERIEPAAPDADREHRGRGRRHGAGASTRSPGSGRSSGRCRGRRRGRVLPGHLSRFGPAKLETVADRLKAITGRIDLVHGNNSRDEFGSGRDRHADMESGTIDPTLILDVIRAAGAPVICETPTRPPTSAGCAPG